MTNAPKAQNPIRLQQVLLAAGEGGAETFFEKLAVAFHEHGLTQQLIVARGTARYERLKAKGLDVTAIPSTGLMKWFAPLHVRRCADAFSPSIILGWLNRACASLPRRAGSENIGRLGGYYKLKNYRRCDHLVANTPGIQKYLIDHGWPVERAHLISNFGEVPHSADSRSLRTELRIPGHHRVLLNLGRLHPSKAQDVLIRSLARIPDATLLIGGEGTLRSALETQARQLGVFERIRLLGWRNDTANLFRTADVCVFPSRVEPLGNVVLEAWSLEVPIVCAKADGPAWLIEHEKNGLLVDIDDDVALARETLRMLTDGNLRQRCVNNGSQKFRTQFSEEVIVNQYLELLSSVSR